MVHLGEAAGTGAGGAGVAKSNVTAARVLQAGRAAGVLVIGRCRTAGGRLSRMAGARTCRRLNALSLSYWQKDQGNDPTNSDNRRSRCGGWNSPRLGLFVRAIVQYLSLQKVGARPAARLHEPARWVLSHDRIKTKVARQWPRQRMNCRADVCRPRGDRPTMAIAPPLRRSRGSDPRLLRLTMDRLLDRMFGERPLCIKARPCPRLG